MLLTINTHGLLWPMSIQLTYTISKQLIGPEEGKCRHRQTHSPPPCLHSFWCLLFTTGKLCKSKLIFVLIKRTNSLEFHKWLLFVLVYIHVRMFRPDTRGEQVGGHRRVMRPLNLHATSLVIVGIRFLYSSRLLVMWYCPGERSAAVRRAARSVLTYFTDISLSSSFSCLFCGSHYIFLLRSFIPHWYFYSRQNYLKCLFCEREKTAISFKAGRHLLNLKHRTFFSRNHESVLVFLPPVSNR